MKLAHLLRERNIRVPLAAATLEEALEALIEAQRGSVADRDRALARDLASGRSGAIAPVGEQAVVVRGTESDRGLTAVSVGVSREPLIVSAAEASRRVRVVVLVLAPETEAEVAGRLVEALADALEGQESVLAQARSADDVLSNETFMGVDVTRPLLVADALSATTYRVYPDTPLDEVVDLMLRRGLRALPVVGENYEVLGIITTGDALRHLLPKLSDLEGEEPTRASPEQAREAMTRSVMCVAEDQTLVEAAGVMVNRNVDQIPVVRDGEFVGFLTRDAVLRKLVGDASSPHTKDTNEEGQPT